MKIRRNKKGQTESFSWLEVIEIIAAAALIIISTYVAVKYGGLLIKNRDTQPTFDHFNSLLVTIDGMENDPHTFVSYDDYPYYIGKDFFVMGFSDKIFNNKQGVLWPEKCLDWTCLCLFDIDEMDKMDDDRSKGDMGFYYVGGDKVCHILDAETINLKELSDELVFVPDGYGWTYRGTSNGLKGTDEVINLIIYKDTIDFTNNKYEIHILESTDENKKKVELLKDQNKQKYQDAKDLDLRNINTYIKNAKERGKVYTYTTYFGHTEKDITDTDEFKNIKPLVELNIKDKIVGRTEYSFTYDSAKNEVTIAETTS